MLKYFENDKIIIDEVHNNYKYTYELMRSLSNDYNCELYLIMGADNIIDFDKWMNYQELLKYKIIVVNRDNININKYINKFNSSNFIVVNDYKYKDISSSEIRNNLGNIYLDKRVLKYIKDNHLYE